MQYEDAPSAAFRVLIVDDDLDRAECLEMILKYSGYDVCIAGNCTQALAIAADFLPQVAVIDIRIPEVDGLEIGRRMRRQQADEHEMVLIAVTGLEDEGQSAMCEAAGFEFRLVGPVHPEALMGMLRDICSVMAHAQLE